MACKHLQPEPRLTGRMLTSVSMNPRRARQPNLPYCTTQAFLIKCVRHLIGQDTHRLDILTKISTMITRTKDFSILMYLLYRRNAEVLKWQLWLPPP